MREQLRLISEATPAGYQAVVIMDRASWHQSYTNLIKFLI